MTDDLFRKYSSAVRNAYSRELRCDEGAFDDEALAIVDRPQNTGWYTAMAVTFGTGTVLSIDPAYREFAEANRPMKHFRVMSPQFLDAIVAEGRQRGAKLAPWSPSLCFTIDREPPHVTPPNGFELVEHDAVWMNAEQLTGRFENGVGASWRIALNRFALALHDPGGEVAAVAGAFDKYGLLEIGVDVLRPYRGLGLGRLVVSALAHEIMRRGETPWYECAPTNVRSHITAEACGFRVVLSDAGVLAPEE